ncbi:MAG: hypothetical protein IJX38_02470 [Clostridia bacterium]|nr:hypothetical protein [Clostridia bacterium]
MIYEIFAFDGTNFHPLESGKADTGTVVHRLSAPEGGSYRLRVDAKAAFVDDGCFRITYEK